MQQNHHEGCREKRGRAGEMGWESVYYKNMFYFRLFVVLVFVFTTIPMVAQDDSSVSEDLQSEAKSFRVYYPVNRTDLYFDYMENAENLSDLRRYFANSSLLDSIVIYSYSSPEGPLDTNAQLSQKRAATAKRYIQNLLPELPSEAIKLRPEAENWDGLREEVEQRYHRDDREEVLKILAGSEPDSIKKEKLKHIDNGQSWLYIIRYIMPQLRYATWISVWRKINQELPSLEMDTLMLAPAVKSDAAFTTRLPSEMLLPNTKTILALKTNLLYDAASLLNLSVEVPVYKNEFSVLYQHHFPWWTWGKGNNEYCIRYLSFGGEARWWFKPQPQFGTDWRVPRDKLTGHFLGLYVMGGKWDFEWGRNICYQGEFFSTGVSYGYSRPIGKRLNLEFTISLGYASIPYRHYTPTDDYEYLIRDPEKHGTWHYWGPTKAEISLVMPILFTQWKKGGGK